MPMGLGLPCDCCGGEPCFSAQATVEGNETDGSDAGSACAACEDLDATYALGGGTEGGSITPQTSLDPDRAESLCLWTYEFTHCSFINVSIAYQLNVEYYRNNDGDLALFVQQRITETGSVQTRQWREGIALVTGSPVDETVTLTDTFNDNNFPFSGLAPLYCNDSATITVRVEQL